MDENFFQDPMHPAVRDFRQAVEFIRLADHDIVVMPDGAIKVYMTDAEGREWLIDYAFVGVTRLKYGMTQEEHDEV